MWNLLANVNWEPLPSLGVKWVGKWIALEDGYILMVSDGIDLWGEHQNSTYIQEKSEEWAACLECGMKELSDLILSHFRQEQAGLRILAENEPDKLTIELTASLHQFPYNWLFCLSKLGRNIVEEHLSSPLITSLEYLSEKIRYLEKELKKRNSLIEEYLPSTQVRELQKNISGGDGYKSCFESAVKNISEGGQARVLSANVVSVASISNMEAKLKRNPGVLKSSSFVPSSAAPHNRPKMKIKRTSLKGAFQDDSCLPLVESGTFSTRRENTESISNQMAENALRKKKKILRI